MQKDKNGNEIFFALDIGTRSIMGLLGHKENEKIIIDNVCVELHKKRAMYDGQVHDIQAVADVALIVKNKLEEESGIKLTNVAVAAAGRSLKTIQSSAIINFDEERIVDIETIKELEIKCLQEASDKLKEDNNENISYYNVGHTVMTYKLDDYEIKNPNGHKGKKLSLELIATFLPKIVVEALDSVMNKIDLNISYMTLEPIVAIEVAIPENVRLLNIAMVDIGAGTSDIAITKDGTIIGYSMTSTAGDEITEAISQKYLLDFDSAEKLKCNLYTSEKQKFTDIVGMETETTTTEILKEIEESIFLVANNISEAIIKTNGKSPSAVFLIGGGSQIPGLTQIIANNLGLPENRVAIKSVESISNIENNSELLIGPQSVTPVGILTSSIQNEKKDFMSIFINDKNIKLFRSNELKISDALILAGYNPRDLIARKGKPLILTVNGEKKIFSGDYGNEANIFINGNKANIDTKINDGDSIKIVPATTGDDANVNLKKLLKPEYIYVNDDPIPNIYNLRVNNIYIYDLNHELSNYDDIRYESLDTTEKLKTYLNLDENKILLINDKQSKYDISIYANDKIYVNDKNENLNSVELQQKKEYIINVTCNNEPIIMKSNKNDFIFVEIFDYIKFDRSKPQGNLILKVNNQKAEFTTKINNGDILEIYWEK